MVEILIVYGSQYGNTQRIAQAIAHALTTEHRVRLMHAPMADAIAADDVDLLIIGAPTQMRGQRLLVERFMRGLERGFCGVAAAAFDTRIAGMGRPTAAEVISRRLAKAGCRVVAEPAGFEVTGLDGPLAPGEEDRAAAWALALVEQVAVRT
jgi:flavodoxin